MRPPLPGGRNGKGECYREIALSYRQWPRIAADGAAQTSDVVTWRDLDQRRRRHPALGDRVRTARVEMAAGRRLGRARHVALHDALALTAALGIGRGRGRQQGLGVGVQRPGEERALVGKLDD